MKVHSALPGSAGILPATSPATGPAGTPAFPGGHSVRSGAQVHRATSLGSHLGWPWLSQLTHRLSAPMPITVVRKSV